MSFILSDILPTMGHSQYAMVHGIVGTWLSSPRTFIGSWSVWGLIRLLSGFPSTDIILPLWGKTKWVMCEFFHQYHVPLCHGIVGTRKPSPRTFIGQWAGGEHIPHYVLWGMVVCLFVGIVSHLPTLLLYKMVGENPMKKYVLIFFNIFF